MGVLQHDFYQLCLTVVSLTLMLTPFGVRLSPRIARLFSRTPGSQDSRGEEQRLPKLKDHVIICGFGPLGSSLGKMLQKHSIPFIVLELNPQTVKRLKKEQIPIIFGDNRRKLDEALQCGRPRIERCRPGLYVRDVFETTRQRLHQLLLLS
jgi:CPA2 family monovalent cation:H+ antiporter-2